VFIDETLQSSKAKGILEKLFFAKGMSCFFGSIHNTQHVDVKSLGYTAYAMCFFNETPADIFPCVEMQDLAVKILGKGSEALVKSIFTYYYTGLLSQAINNRPFIFVAINSFVTDNRKVISWKIH
jgi:hypothetical protein